ncbi:MAG: DUF4097 family beta strand repeat-containing protein [Candidatus Izemoplasmatales bacterium]
MKKFLEELEKELQSKGLSKEDITEILSDHQEMIDEAIAEGLSEEEIETKFGRPSKIADDLSDLAKLETKNTVNSKEYTLFKSFHVLDSEMNIDIHFVNEDYHLEKSETNDIEVYYKGKGKLEDYEFGLNGQTFYAKSKKQIRSSLFFFSHNEFEFLIKVPDVSILLTSLHSVNSDITVDNLKCDSFVLKSTNGDLVFTNMKTKSFKFDNVNGDLKITNFESNDLRLSNVNGDVKFNHVDIEGDVVFNTVSGDLSVNTMKCRECHFQTVSGDMSAKEFYPEAIRLQSVSGDISIRNEDKTKSIRIISQKSLSGEIKIH